MLAVNFTLESANPENGNGDNSISVNDWDILQRSYSQLQESLPSNAMQTYGEAKANLAYYVASQNSGNIAKQAFHDMLTAREQNAEVSMEYLGVRGNLNFSVSEANTIPSKGNGTFFGLENNFHLQMPINDKNDQFLYDVQSAVLYSFMKNFSLGVLGEDDSCDFRSHIPIISSTLSAAYSTYGLQFELDVAQGTLAYLQTPEAQENPIVTRILGDHYVIDIHGSQTAPNAYQIIHCSESAILKVSKYTNSWCVYSVVRRDFVCYGLANGNFRLMEAEHSELLQASAVTYNFHPVDLNPFA